MYLFSHNLLIGLLSERINHFRIVLMFSMLVIINSCNKNKASLIVGRYWNLAYSNDSTTNQNLHHRTYTLFLSKNGEVYFNDRFTNIAKYKLIGDSLYIDNYNSISYQKIIKITEDSVLLEEITQKKRYYAYYNDRLLLNKKSTISSFSMEISDCFRCANFVIAIDSIGNIKYKEKKNTALSGYYTGAFSDSTMNKIYDYIKLSNIYNQPEQFEFVSDSPKTVFVFKQGSSNVKTISGQIMPFRLEELKSFIMSNLKTMTLQKSDSLVF